MWGQIGRSALCWNVRNLKALGIIPISGNKNKMDSSDVFYMNNKTIHPQMIKMVHRISVMSLTRSPMAKLHARGMWCRKLL